jgi:hypothetical protein
MVKGQSPLLQIASLHAIITIKLRMPLRKAMHDADAHAPAQLGRLIANFESKFVRPCRQKFLTTNAQTSTNPRNLAG